MYPRGEPRCQFVGVKQQTEKEVEAMCHKLQPSTLFIYIHAICYIGALIRCVKDTPHADMPSEPAILVIYKR